MNIGKILPLLHKITSFPFFLLFKNKGEACVNLELLNLCLDGAQKLLVPGCDQIPFWGMLSTFFQFEIRTPGGKNGSENYFNFTESFPLP